MSKHPSAVLLFHWIPVGQSRCDGGEIQRERGGPQLIKFPNEIRAFFPVINQMTCRRRFHHLSNTSQWRKPLPDPGAIPWYALPLGLYRDSGLGQWAIRNRCRYTTLMPRRIFRYMSTSITSRKGTVGPTEKTERFFFTGQGDPKRVVWSMRGIVDIPKWYYYMRLTFDWQGR